MDKQETPSITHMMKFDYLSKNPALSLTIGAVSISFSGVWVKIAEVTPASSAFYRVFFGLLFLLILSSQSQKKIIPSKLHLFWGSVCGILFALDLLCWHSSIILIGPGLATLLGNFQVFILAGVGIFFFKERYSKVLVIAIPMAVTGLFLIVGFDWVAMSPAYKSGIYLGLTTALLYSAFLLALKVLTVKCESSYYPMILVSSTTAVIISIYLLAKDYTFAIPDIKSFGSLAGLGFFSQCFGWLCIASSLPKINTSQAGLILLLQPSLSFIWDVLFFGRPTDLLNWTGVIITLTAIYLGMRAKS